MEKNVIPREKKRAEGEKGGEGRGFSHAEGGDVGFSHEEKLHERAKKNPSWLPR